MVDRLKGAVDRLQRRFSALGVPLAIVKKFGDDRAGQQAALLAYYGFFSVFPLLLLATTVLGFVLDGRPELRGDVLDSALAQFPIVGDEIRSNLGTIGASGVGLVIGLAGALWAGLGVMKGLGTAMDQLWNVPFATQPKFPMRIVRGLGLLCVLGLFVIASTAVSAAGIPIVGRVVAFAGSLALNVGVALVAFKVVTAADVTWREVLPGAVVAGVAWAALQSAGHFLVAERLANASALYGFFGIVLGLLSFMYLSAQIVLLAAEMNVVLARKLWPRSLTDDLTDADHRVLTAYAQAQQRVDEQQITVSFDPT